MREVIFIDTTILCNLVPVPGRDQNQEIVVAEMKKRLAAREEFILPITAVIETGNFIAQISDGSERRSTAEKMSSILRLVCEGRSPWVLHDVAWNREFLEKLLAGADTAASYVDHAQNKVGLGDLCILTERFHYDKRTNVRAKIWTLDAGLAAYAPHRQP